MKCYINNRGFFIPTELLTNELITKIKMELNVSPANQFTEYNVPVYRIYTVIKGIGLIVPIYYGLELGLEYTSNFTEPKTKINFENFKDKIILRKGTQEETFEKCMLEFNKPFGGGILELGTATGKTVTSLKIIAESKKIALVVVNKIELLNQWKKEIQQFMPNARIGIIQGKIFDVIDKDIIIGMLQTITIKKELTYKDFLFNEITVIDEAHNLSTEVFSQIIFKIRPKYLFGLTATLKRKDELEKIVHWYIGPVLFSNISNEKKDATEIHIYKYRGPSSVDLKLKDNETPACSKMLSNIADDTERNDLIINILKRLTVDPKRNILVISDRISQLKYLNSKLTNSALFIGSMKSVELDISKESQILLATYKLASEGFSLAKLNCLMFATSRSNVTQAIGRIYRKKHEITPIIVDIYDDFSYFKNQYYKRRKVYKELITKCIFKNLDIRNQNKIVSIQLPEPLPEKEQEILSQKQISQELTFDTDSDTENEN
jgi:superfamily II DNA or RNA helicase